jgi:hypothetical protein
MTSTPRSETCPICFVEIAWVHVTRHERWHENAVTWDPPERIEQATAAPGELR